MFIRIRSRGELYTPLPAGAADNTLPGIISGRIRMDLTGMVALVTGGNGGLGQRICHALAKQGAHIAVMYARSREQAEGVVHELQSQYQIQSAAFGCDITDGAAVDTLITDVTRRFGRIDILVNDAAYNKSIPFTD